MLNAFRNRCWAIAILMCTAAPAHAFTFTLVNGSTDQRLTWFWQRSPNWTCNPCGDAFSINAEIPLNQAFPSGSSRAGGMLDWTASSGRLTVVAMLSIWVNTTGAPSWADYWVSVDSRTPPTFMLIPEAGESIPFTANLLIRPRIVGTLERFSGAAGGQAQTILHVLQEVQVNGIAVTHDELHYDATVSNGQSLVGPVTFPKGTLNNVVVPGVQNGAFITIPSWAYMRALLTDYASITTLGQYGDGIALEIDISNANAVAVENDVPPPLLSLAASPNPGSGATRASYRLPRAGQVRLTIYDVAGHIVARLADGWQEGGRHEVSWNGRSASGDPLASGVYVMELVSGAERRVHKLVRLSR